MSENLLPDPLENFLREPPNLPPPVEFEAALRLRTASLLHRPRPWRYWPILAGCAAAIALAYFVLRPQQDEHPRGPDQTPTGPPLVAEKPPVPEPAPESPSAAAPVDPLAIEWQAFDAPDDRERVRQYFRAGDLYLVQGNDVESALRCYRQAFAYCEADDLAFSPRDNWLVMALKRDHRKEN